MTGLEYQNTVCPTTSVGKDPNREDVADAFEDGIAEGYKRGVNDAIEKACEWLKFNLQDYAGEDSFGNSVPFDKDVFEAFRKAMEEYL